MSTPSAAAAAPASDATSSLTMTTTGTDTAVPAGVLPPPPSQMEALMWNGAFIAVMVIMFYLLLIRPQQTRYREHADMLKKLHKGDKVVLQSGMIATIDHIAADSEEMTVELAPGNKVHILRSAIAGTYKDIVKKG